MFLSDLKASESDNIQAFKRFTDRSSSDHHNLVWTLCWEFLITRYSVQDRKKTKKKLWGGKAEAGKGKQREKDFILNKLESYKDEELTRKQLLSWGGPISEMWGCHAQPFIPHVCHSLRACHTLVRTLPECWCNIVSVTGWFVFPLDIDWRNSYYIL